MIYSFPAVSMNALPSDAGHTGLGLKEMLGTAELDEVALELVSMSTVAELVLSKISRLELCS